MLPSEELLLADEAVVEVVAVEAVEAVVVEAVEEEEQQALLHRTRIN